METPGLGVKIVCVQSWQAIYWRLEVHEAEGVPLRPVFLGRQHFADLSISMCPPKKPQSMWIQ